MRASSLLRVAVGVVLWVSTVTPMAEAATDYRQVVDLTFPTEPGARYVDDYHHTRGGGARRHRAIDLFTAHGTPVHAAVGGTITWMPDRPHATAGWAIHVRGTDGRTYAYYHLGRSRTGRASAYAAGLRGGSHVSRGQLIGYVGDSGNATAGPAHLHFEIHDPRVRDPYGSNRLNPFRSLQSAQARGDYAGGGRASRGGARSNVLRRGSRGQAVADWQRALNRAGAGIAVDGVFGPVTERATRRFQAARGITVDGVVGPQTQRAMASVVGTATRAGVLRRGSRGQAVAEWQRSLNRTGAGLAIDGVFGPLTERATRDFQAARGITVDGVVGPQTRSAMAAAGG